MKSARLLLLIFPIARLNAQAGDFSLSSLAGDESIDYSVG
jgi:hypothetical protein